MSNAAAPTGAVTPAPKSLIARFVGVITSPRDTYESIVAHPKVLGMLLLTCALMAASVGGFMLTKVGQDAWLEAATTSSFSGPVSDQQYQAMERMAPFVGYFTMGYMVVVFPIFIAVLAGILFAVFNAMLGGNATFKQLYTVLVHVLPVGVLSQIITVPLNYARGTMTSSTNLGMLTQSFLPDTSFVGRFLGMVDVFILWQLVVLAIGLAVLYRRRTQPIATTFFVIYGVIAVIIAFVRRGAGA